MTATSWKNNGDSILLEFPLDYDDHFSAGFWLDQFVEDKELPSHYLICRILSEYHICIYSMTDRCQSDIMLRDRQDRSETA
jgi:hypothetical protein